MAVDAAQRERASVRRARARIRPTELGLKGVLLLGALVLAFFSASYSNLFFLIIAFCAVLGLAGLGWTARNTKGLTVRLVDAPAAPAGSARQVVVAIASRHERRAAFDLTIAVEFDATDPGGPAPAKRSRSAAIELAHVPLLQGEQVLECELPPQDRGLQRIATIQCSSRYPFGLFKITRAVAIDLEIVTYPRPEDGGRGAHFGPGAAGADDGAGGGRSTAIAGLRPFRSGDALGDMHWKASARRGEPVVKEREPGGQDIEEQIVVDRRCPADELDRRLARATAAVFRAHECERSMRLVSQGFEAAVDSGRDLTPLLRWLATASPAAAAAGPPASRSRTANPEAARV